MRDDFSASKLRNASLVIAAALLISCFMLPATALGQQSNATLQGTVTDSSGAAAPGARIVLTNEGTNVGQTATSDERGYYFFTFIPPGSYKLTVELKGFQTFVQNGVILQVQQQASVDVVLRPGDISTTVQVTGEAPRLDAVNATVGRVIEYKTMEDMPLGDWNVISLVSLTPGVHGDPAVWAGGTGTNFYSNGTRNSQGDIIVDGSSVTGGNPNGAVTQALFKPAIDATQEFKVLTNSFSAEFGQSGGTIVNIVTRSGTNNLHGSLYEFHRDNAMAANSWNGNRYGQKINPFRRNDFGGTIGGPVYLPKVYNGRNRTFFFFSHHNMKQGTRTSATETVPTALQKSGDFSQTLNQSGALMQIFDPVTTHQGTDGRWVRDPFPGNIIPLSRQDPMARKLVAFYPDPNVQGNQYTNINDYFKMGAYNDADHQYTAKIDHNFNESNRLSVRYSFDYLSHDYPNFWGNPQFPLQQAPQNYSIYNPAMEFTHTFSPTTIFDVRWGMIRNVIWKRPVCGSDCVFNNSDYGFVSPVDFQIRPYFTIAGFDNLGPDPSNQLSEGELVNTFAVSLTRVAGKHTMKFGSNGKLDMINKGQPGVNNGYFTFGQNATMQYKDYPNTNQGNGLASFLLGWASGGSDSTSLPGAFSQKSYNFFFQDHIQLTPKLVVNVGLRWELDMPFTERYNRLAWVDLNVPTPIAISGYPNLTGAFIFADPNHRSPYDPQWKDFAPRFGLAYRFASKMVLRAGYGIYYAPNQDAMYANGLAPGFAPATSMVTSLDSGVTQYGTLDNPFPGGLNPVTGSSLGLMTNVGRSLYGQVPAWGIKPYNEQWNISIERELPLNSVIEVNYSGNRGVHLYYDSYTNLDLLPTRAWNLGTSLNDQVANPFYGIITTSTSSLSFPTVTRSQLLRPHPQFTSISGNVGPPSSNSIFHGLQVKYTKRYSRSLTLNVSYTLSKMMDQSSLPSTISWLGGVSDNGVQYIDDTRKEWAVSSFDRAHSIVVDFTYELPFGRGRKLGTNWNRALDWIAGGWQVNGILSYTSGSPIALGLASGVLPDATQRANLLCYPGTSGSVHDRLNNYFNSACFSRPATYVPGTAPRFIDTVRNPSGRGDDLSMFKNIYFSREKQRYLQLRGEAFNALNHPVFGGPNATYGSQSFGIISGTSNSPRQLQVAAKVYF
jgi:hypothetical protein